MYGRMQFADFVASHALQLNTQCLHALAEASGDEPLADKDLLIIRGDVQRLASLWQMLHWSIGKSAYRQGRRRTDLALELIPEGREWVDRAIRQIAGKTDDQRRLRALDLVSEQVLGALAVAPKADWSELGQIFHEDSECWRDDSALRQVQDSDLIEHGITRAYEKSRRLCQAFAARPTSRKRLGRVRRWLQHCVNHLELMQPALSDSSKVHVWYLERLQANVEKQFIVQRFVDVAFSLRDIEAIKPDFKPKVRARVQSMAQARTERLQSRSNKLMVGAFETSAGDFSRAVGGAVRKLALQEIVLLPLPGQASPGPGKGSG